MGDHGDAEDAIKWQAVDRGWAWVVMMAICMWNFIIAGTLKSSGVIYLAILDLFEESPSRTALVGFTFSFVITIISPVSGYISDHHPIRTWTFVCAAICGLGMAMCGLMPDLTAMIWMYGFLCGTMAGIMDSPFLGLFNKYFRRKRSVANGVAFSGSSLGCLILPLMLRWSIDAYTIRGAMFFMGGVWMHACVVAAVMCPLPARDRITMSWEVTPGDDSCTAGQRKTFGKAPDAQAGETTDEEAAGMGLSEMTCSSDEKCNTQDSLQMNPSRNDTSAGKVLIGQSLAPQVCIEKPAKQRSGCMSCFSALHAIAADYIDFLSNPELLRFTGVLVFSGFAYFNQLFFWPAYAREIGLSELDGSLVVSIAGISELIGRPFIGYLGSRFNKTLLCLTTNCLTCIAGMLTYMVPQREVLMGFAAVFGLFGGTVCVLGLPILSEAVGPQRIGSAAGLFPLALSIGSAAGPPILGYIREITGFYANSLRVATIMYVPACLLLAWNLHCIDRVLNAFRSRTGNTLDQVS